MRAAVIADIHGNQIALEAVLQDLAQQAAVDHLVIAGDLCLNGPCPRQALEMVRELHCPVIQGNVDAEIVTKAVEKGEKKRGTVGWTRELIWQDGTWKAEIRRVAYDVQEVVKQIKSCGMPNVEKRIKTLLEARY